MSQAIRDDAEKKSSTEISDNSEYNEHDMLHSGAGAALVTSPVA
jgi:hypothetical protein